MWSMKKEQVIKAAAIATADAMHRNFFAKFLTFIF